MSNIQYCITMEQTRRTAVWFDADSDEAAEEKAEQINSEMTSGDYADGDEERDYTLHNLDTKMMLIDWD